MPLIRKKHVKRFHELFFTLSPDKDAIESNIRRALFLVDRSAFSYYRDLQEIGTLGTSALSVFIAADGAIAFFD